ncbi:MAG: 2,3-bisphosphoglycerate-independent phosphoglycerate mutase [Synergistales bacterium]|nr:2,3-bisphosphoglycerate-independent phosphoglycerate mutase [Synergistales bacterium]
MRTLLLVLDGLGDKGIKDFNGKTPLQVAHTPNMDAIARAGCNGLYHATLQGMAMPSEMAHFIIFGYDLDKFPGRGYIEAKGEGISCGRNDVAVLGRIFHVEPRERDFILRNEKIDVDPETFRILSSTVSSYSSSGLSLRFHPTGGIGGIFVIQGEASAEITDSNPIFEGRPIMAIKPLRSASSPSLAEKTAQFLNNYSLWSHDILSQNPLNTHRSDHGLPPLNMVGLQRAGQWKEVPSFRDKWGMKALCIASGTIYHGLCSHLGMDIHKTEDTGNCEKDLLGRLKSAYEAKDHDLVYVHTKAPDEAAHKRDPHLKRQVIEALDRALGWAVKEILPDEDILLVLTSDHSTASTGTMIHSGETVPISIVGRYTRRDHVSSFNEIDCAMGGLGDVRGHEIMYMILNLMDRGKLKGLMDSPEDQPYSPGLYTSLGRH